MIGLDLGLVEADTAAGHERKLTGASRRDASEYDPTMWRGRVAFTRVSERR